MLFTYNYTYIIPLCAQNGGMTKKKCHGKNGLIQKWFQGYFWLAKIDRCYNGPRMPKWSQRPLDMSDIY